jgi:hypothetical protein
VGLSELSAVVVYTTMLRLRHLRQNELNCLMLD